MPRRLDRRVTHLQRDLFSKCRVGVGEGAGHPDAHGNACGTEEVCCHPLRLLGPGPSLLGTVCNITKSLSSIPLLPSSKGSFCRANDNPRWTEDATGSEKVSDLSQVRQLPDQACHPGLTWNPTLLSTRYHEGLCNPALAHGMKGPRPDR